MSKTQVVLIVAIIFVFYGQRNLSAQIEDSPGRPVIPLWPNGLPKDAKPVSEAVISKQRQREKQRSEIIGYVDEPSLTVYQPKDDSNGCAMIICPGGGYNILAWPKEGLEVAEYLNAYGVTAFVLRYRVPRRDKKKIHWEPMQDVQRAVRIVRANSKAWKIDPERIGVMGFSAGGHLTVMAGTEYETNSYPRVDNSDQLSSRPNFICPIYAAYLGPGFSDDKSELDPNLKLNKHTPPTFLAVTGDDKMRGVQAALLYARLRELEIPAELHVYARGGHGYGIRPSKNPVSTWHHRMTDWLRSQGYFDTK